jgi:hypothetical protein
MRRPNLSPSQDAGLQSLGVMRLSQAGGFCELAVMMLVCYEGVLTRAQMTLRQPMSLQTKVAKKGVSLGMSQLGQCHWKV